VLRATIPNNWEQETKTAEPVIVRLEVPQNIEPNSSHEAKLNVETEAYDVELVRLGFLQVEMQFDDVEMNRYDLLQFYDLDIIGAEGARRYLPVLVQNTVFFTPLAKRRTLRDEHVDLMQRAGSEVFLERTRSRWWASR
jgi:hypothetical protein